jgi:transposase
MTINAICKRVAGLDVHKKIIVATVLLEESEGQLHEETREFCTLPRDLKALEEWLSFHQIELTVMESTGVYWKDIHAVLEKGQLNVLIVNAKHIKQVPGRKTDLTDSQWLAYLGRCGLLKGSFIPEEPLRELRLLTRYRVKLQRMIASEKNRLHKTLDASGLRLGVIVSDLSGISAQAVINGLIYQEKAEIIFSKLRGVVKKKKELLRQLIEKPLSPAQRFLLQRILSHIHSMEMERAALDRMILEFAQPYMDYCYILETIPGIDFIGAVTLIAEFGVDMSQFANQATQFCSWAGMCPGNNESAGKRKSGKTRKANTYVRSMMCEISNAAIKTKSQFKDKYKTLVIRKGHKKAIVAIGHKILRVIFNLFTQKKHYQDPGIDYGELQVSRNASRWLKALTQYGFINQTG